MKLLGFPFLSLQCSELCSEVNLLEGLLTLSRAGSGTRSVCVMMLKDAWMLELHVVALGRTLSESGCSLTRKIQRN